MKKIGKSVVLGILGLALVMPFSYVLAYNPTLSAQYQSGIVQISVSNANPYSQVDLYSRQSSSLWTVVSNVGRTDGSGYFTQGISMQSDNSNSPIQMYVTVGGQQSSTISVYPGNSTCTYNCGGNIYLSQTSLSLSIGQSSTVTAYNTYGSIYISSNSNSNVASASVSGSQINIYANNSGSTTITVCASSNGCATLYVSVSGTSTGSITFSPSNPTVNVGQSAVVYINSNMGGSYYISSNSNSNIVSASISGSTLTLYGNQNGSANITVCQSNFYNCGTLYVTVSGSSVGVISFSPSNPSLTVGQSTNVAIYNSNNSGGSYYISSNSNSNVASASVSGSTLNLYAYQNGSTNIMVCQNSGSNCGTLYVTVSGSGSGSISLSQTSLNLSSGQSSTVTAYNYGGSLYISSNSNSNVASANVSGSSINIYANQSGSTTITVCGTSSNCASLYVTVSGSSTGNISLSQTSLSLNSGQSSSVSIYGNGSYYISSNSNSSVASASINSSTLNVYANNTSGNATITVCQNNSGGCATLYVYVNSGTSGNLYFTTTSLPNIYMNQYYNYQLQVSGGTSPYFYNVISGSLPSGLTLSSSGQIYGYPTNAATQSFVVRVTDNSGRSGQANFVINGGGVLGSSIYQNGTLINENGTVYIVYKNTKTGFASADVFTALGFNFSNVINVGSTGLFNSGYIVRTSFAPHPWGTWIKSGQTIYFVHESGLIPVPDWNTFINNGGQNHLVVGANSYDFSLPMLYSMSMNDSRLR